MTVHVLADYGIQEEVPRLRGDGTSLKMGFYNGFTLVRSKRSDRAFADNAGPREIALSWAPSGSRIP